MTYRQQLHRLDVALLDLLDERSRLRATGALPADPEDLLRRYQGDLPADALRSVLTVIDQACEPRASKNGSGSGGDPATEGDKRTPGDRPRDDGAAS